MRKPKRKGRTAADLTIAEVNRIITLRRNGLNHTALSRQFRLPIYEVLKIVR